MELSLAFPSQMPSALQSCATGQASSKAAAAGSLDVALDKVTAYVTIKSSLA